MDTHLILSQTNCSTTAKTPNDTKPPFMNTPAEIAIPVACLDGLAIILGATLNMLVMVMIAKHSRKLQHMDLFIFNLCFSEFLSSVLYQPLVIVRLLADNEMTSTHAQIFRMFTLISVTGTFSSLFLVTADRYLFIRFPFRYAVSVSKSKVAFSIICAWLIVLLFGTLSVAPDVSYLLSQVHGTYTIILFLLTILFQILTFLVAKRQEDRERKLQKSVSHNHQETNTDMCAAGQGGRRLMRTKAATTVTILFAVYVLTWIPSITLNVYHALTKDRKTFLTCIYVAIAFFQLHACLNPFIYVFRTRRIREKIFTPQSF